MKGGEDDSTGTRKGLGQTIARNKIQKILQEFMTLFGKNGLWVELHPMNRKLPVGQAHDFLVIGPGGDLKRIG